MHNLLEISLTPSVPASLCNIPTKYNIIIRLWTHAFHKLLETLCHASFTSLLALEHLQDFIYYAYTFYTGLLEEQTLQQFRAGWLEALGDLARYRMAVATMVTGARVPGPEELTTAALSAVQLDSPHHLFRPLPLLITRRICLPGQAQLLRCQQFISTIRRAPVLGWQLQGSWMSNRTKRGGDASLETGTPKVWQTLQVLENYTITSVC